MHTTARERGLLALWCALAGGTLAAWLALHGWAMHFDHPPPDGLALVGAFVAGLPAALGGWHAMPVAATRLTWSDGRWAGSSPGHEGVAPLSGRLEPMIDLGIWMLLRFRSTAPALTRWLAVDAGRAGAAWHPLRAALFQPAAGSPPAEA